MIQDNATTPIRNTSIIDNLKENIVKLQSIQSLISKFQTDKESLSDIKIRVFFDTPCEICYSPLYFLEQEVLQEECSQVSRGSERLGLLSVIAELASELSLFLDQFLAATRDETTLNSFYTQAIDTFIAKIDVATTLNFMLFSSTVTDFNKLIDELHEQSIIFAVAAIPLGFLLGMITWKYAVRRIILREDEKKHLIPIIPTNIILNNKYLKKWIRDKTSSGNLRAVRVR